MIKIIKIIIPILAILFTEKSISRNLYDLSPPEKTYNKEIYNRSDAAIISSNAQEWCSQSTNKAKKIIDESPSISEKGLKKIVLSNDRNSQHYKRIPKELNGKLDYGIEKSIEKLKSGYSIEEAKKSCLQPIANELFPQGINRQLICENLSQEYWAFAKVRDQSKNIYEATKKIEEVKREMESKGAFFKNDTNKTLNEVYALKEGSPEQIEKFVYDQCMIKSTVELLKSK